MISTSQKIELETIIKSILDDGATLDEIVLEVEDVIESYEADEESDGYHVDEQEYDDEDDGD